jgi:type I restriction enzyme, S subunit
MKLRVDKGNLPSGWELKKFGEITILSRGQNPPKSEFVHKPQEGYVRFYQIRDGHNDDYEVYVPDTPQIHKVEPDDILMVAYRHIGRVFRGAKGAFNVALCKISNKDRSIIDDDYLFYIIPTEFVRGELMKQAERSLIPSMSVKHLAEIEIPVPPLSEQKRIVSIVDEAFEAIDIAIDNTKQNLTNARELFESYLNSRLFNVVSGKATQTLLCITDLIIDCEHKTAPIQEEGIPSIRTPNIGKGHLIFDGVYRVSEETYELWTRRGKPEAGDLILAREAPAGNVGVIPPGAKVCLGQRTVLIRPNKKIIDSHFLAFLLLHPIVQKRLLDKSTGATVQHVNMKDIRGLSMSELPSIQAQKVCVEELEHLKLETQRLEAIYQEKLAALTELKQSILQKAFTGELTADSTNQTIKKAKEVIAA